MRWANFLHFYQPADQQEDILEAIIQQSYKPILEGIAKNKNIRLTLNINGALLELFDKYKHSYLIDILKKIGSEDRIEFTSSSKYHAFLPLIEEKEIIRQIKINDETNKYFLGSVYNPTGFFPPEMAYKEELAPLLENLGFKWVILDEIAYSGEPGKVNPVRGKSPTATVIPSMAERTSNGVNYKKTYKIKGTNLLGFFRERRLSNLIMSAVVRSKETLLQAMKNDLNSGRYLITAMDVETFGHHRPGLEKMLFDIFETPEFELIQISDIPKHWRDCEEISPVKSTWASSFQDIKEGIQFLSWRDPENIIHKFQWNFLQLVLEEFYKIDANSPTYEIIRKKMDKAISSDHFWWASAKPWWSIEMIEIGAWNLLEAIKSFPNVSKETINKVQDFYTKIISTAFNWQRTGRIRQMMKEQKSILRIPFKDRTIGKGGAEKGVYYAFIDLMKKLERKAVKQKEYEKAILWRDAMHKLKNKLDIYDTINAIDLLRVEIPHNEVEEIIEKYKEKYRQIRGGQPEQRGR